jgi:chemosensory pili system protein ChpA (sensor histidine kinase/response regulator)
VPENFDIGPLTWVKDEINQSLDSVLENLSSVQSNPNDTEVLRFSQTYLYQVSGALDMVGLVGCKRFCSELEKLASKLENKSLLATPQMIEDFAKAVKTLKYYIQELLNGAPDIPLRLYSVLSPIMAVLGETLDESELFFPDTSNIAPKDVPSKEFNDEDYKKFIVEQRQKYQKSLLIWLQSKQNSAVESMFEAISNVSFAQHKNRTKTLWWAASAFTETLELPAISENPSAKRLCRKLDQELKQLAEGVDKPHTNLLRDILYFVAISEIDKATVLKVKDVFELDEYIDKKAKVRVNAAMIDTSEFVIIEQLKTELENLREIWDEVSNSIDFDKVDVDADDTLVNLDNVLITKFADKLHSNKDLVNQLSQVVVVDLYSTLLQASNILQDDKSKANHAALIEIAAALHILDSAYTNYEHLDADGVQNLLSEITRLEAISSGLNYDQLESERTGELDRDTLNAVVKDINTSLKVIEQALDTFFRNPLEKSPLTLTHKPIKQIAAIFDMLSLPTPMSIANSSSCFIQYFQDDGYEVKQSDFELVAESLSMIGLYADEMPKVRPESERSLEGALERLNSTLAAAGVEINSHLKVDLVSIPSGLSSPEESAAVDELSDEGLNQQEDKVLDQPFDSELLDIFLTEAEEVLALIAQNLQALRVNNTDNESLVEVRRSYHILKGSGRTVGLIVLGEIAGKVETFLNGVLESKGNLSETQIAKIEDITAAFAVWSSELRANNQVYIDRAHWTAKVVALSSPVENVESKLIETVSPIKKNDAHVLIGGTRELSRALYEIFINESMQNLTKLEQDVAKLAESKTTQPSKEARHAVHTLASNALAAEFIPMGELCRALESWLDETDGYWSAQHLDLYANTVKTVANMWQKISELKNPRTAKALIKVLHEATAQAKQNKALDVDYEDEPQSVSESESDTVTNQAKNGVANFNSEDYELKLVTESRSFKRGSTDVDQELLAMFIDEAHEILPEIGSELRAWRANPKTKKHPEALQRSLHTLKGSARMAGQIAIGDIAHGFEEQVVRVTKRTPMSDDFENMFIELDKIGSYFERTVEDIPEDTGKITNEAGQQTSGRTKDRKSQFLRMRADTLDRLINEAGEISIIRSRMDRELVGFKQSSNDLTESLVRLRSYLRELEIEAETQMQSRMNVLQETNETFDPLEFDRFTRLQELTRMIAESVNDVGTIQSGLLSNLNQTEAALQQQNRMNRDLQQSLLGVRMLPFRQIVDRMQRIVRQTARELKKSVDLDISGEDIEIDRSMLDKLGAPLEHLLRNAVAHGIELPGERKMHGKPQTGNVSLNLRIQNDEIHLTISDDGAGVNLNKVKEIAIKNKLLATDVEVNEQALLSVIFEPGFSTSDKISQISGRGVGLDVVRNDISSLGGRVDLTSEYGKGAVFNIYLPVTQSVAQTLLVRAGAVVYALPVALIEQAQKIKYKDLIAAYHAGEVIWADNGYPLHHLAKLLHQQDHQIEESAYASILLLRSGTYNIALHVDEVIGNQEVVMKPIGMQLARVPGIVGATVTGDGSVVLIINPVQIANREILSAGNVSVKAVKQTAVKQVTRTRALVVDDSLTMRKVLGRLLDREGYDVLLAKDGMDAMQVLQEATPDIILTDIEMPRMDGFGLARNIRDDFRTKNTPLIMISSRTADKHQTLAKEIGVDAFFGKPVQDEELIAKMKELLETKK